MPSRPIRSQTLTFSALAMFSWLVVAEGCSVDADEEEVGRTALPSMGGGDGCGGGGGGGGGDDEECCEDADCDDDDPCTMNICDDGECTYPNEDPRTTCDDEDPANSDTIDQCCEGACYHWLTGGFGLTYPAAPLQSPEVIYDPLPPQDDPDTPVDESVPCPVATFSASLSGPGEGDDADGATFTLTATAVALNAQESQQMGGHSACNPATDVVMEGMNCEGCSYDPSSRTLSITRTRTSTCGGGTLDFGAIEGGTGFGVPASVDISTVCCIIDSVSGTLGPFGGL